MAKKITLGGIINEHANLTCPVCGKKNCISARDKLQLCTRWENIGGGNFLWPIAAFHPHREICCCQCKSKLGLHNPVVGFVALEAFLLPSDWWGIALLAFPLIYPILLLCEVLWLPFKIERYYR